MNLYLVLYTVLTLSAGVVEMTGMPTPRFSGVSFRFPTEQSCQAAAGVNELGSAPITNDDEGCDGQWNILLRQLFDACCEL